MKNAEHIHHKVFCPKCGQEFCLKCQGPYCPKKHPYFSERRMQQIAICEELMRYGMSKDTALGAAELATRGRSRD